MMSIQVLRALCPLLTVQNLISDAFKISFQQLASLIEVDDVLVMVVLHLWQIQKAQNSVIFLQETVDIGPIVLTTKKQFEEFVIAIDK